MDEDPDGLTDAEKEIAKTCIVVVWRRAAEMLRSIAAGPNGKAAISAYTLLNVTADLFDEQAAQMEQQAP